MEPIDAFKSISPFSFTSNVEMNLSNVANSSQEAKNLTQLVSDIFASIKRQERNAVTYLSNRVFHLQYGSGLLDSLYNNLEKTQDEVQVASFLNKILYTQPFRKIKSSSCESNFILDYFQLALNKRMENIGICFYRHLKLFNDEEIWKNGWHYIVLEQCLANRLESISLFLLKETFEKIISTQNESYFDKLLQEINKKLNSDLHQYYFILEILSKIECYFFVKDLNEAKYLKSLFSIKLNNSWFLKKSHLWQDVSIYAVMHSKWKMLHHLQSLKYPVDNSFSTEAGPCSLLDICVIQMLAQQANYLIQNGFSFETSNINNIDKSVKDAFILKALSLGLEPLSQALLKSLGETYFVNVLGKKFSELPKGSEVKAVINNFTWARKILFIACKFECTETIEILLTNCQGKYNELILDLQDSEGNGVLHICCSLFNLDILKLFLHTLPSDVLLQSLINTNKAGQTPLAMACSVDFAKNLLEDKCVNIDKLLAEQDLKYKEILVQIKQKISFEEFKKVACTGLTLLTITQANNYVNSTKYLKDLYEECNDEQDSEYAKLQKDSVLLAHACGIEGNFENYQNNAVTHSFQLEFFYLATTIKNISNSFKTFFEKNFEELVEEFSIIEEILQNSNGKLILELKKIIVALSTLSLSIEKAFIDCHKATKDKKLGHCEYDLIHYLPLIWSRNRNQPFQHHSCIIFYKNYLVQCDCNTIKNGSEEFGGFQIYSLNSPVTKEFLSNMYRGDYSDYTDLGKLLDVKPIYSRKTEKQTVSNCSYTNIRISIYALLCTIFADYCAKENILIHEEPFKKVMSVMKKIYLKWKHEDIKAKLSSYENKYKGNYSAFKMVQFCELKQFLDYVENKIIALQNKFFINEDVNKDVFRPLSNYLRRFNRLCFSTHSNPIGFFKAFYKYIKENLKHDWGLYLIAKMVGFIFDNDLRHLAHIIAEDPIVNINQRQENLLTIECDRLQNTPLHLACKRHNLHLIALLNKYGSLHSNFNANFMTPVDYLWKNRSIMALASLLAKGQKLNKAYELDQNLSRIARLYELYHENYMEQKNTNEVDYCIAQVICNALKALDKGYNYIINVIKFKPYEIQRYPILHWAAFYENFPILHHLIVENGYKIDSFNDKGVAILHQACESGSVRLIEFLLEYGATVDIKDKQGRTPLAIAKQKQRGELFSLLTPKTNFRIKKNQKINTNSQSTSAQFIKKRKTSSDSIFGIAQLKIKDQEPPLLVPHSDDSSEL
ncbi:MAG: ankX 6 [Chlamydiales bacterium]|jgi:ankyrin repeat protein|nr:ankX 6 [Chlamydiales bacterium]